MKTKTYDNSHSDEVEFDAYARSIKKGFTMIPNDFYAEILDKLTIIESSIIIFLNRETKGRSIRGEKLTINYIAIALNLERHRVGKSVNKMKNMGLIFGDSKDFIQIEFDIKKWRSCTKLMVENLPLDGRKPTINNSKTPTHALCPTKSMVENLPRYGRKPTTEKSDTISITKNKRKKDCFSKKIKSSGKNEIETENLEASIISPLAVAPAGGQIKDNSGIKISSLSKNKKSGRKKKNYSEEFLTLWKIYPKSSGHSKSKAHDQWEITIANNTAENVAEGIYAYLSYCTVTRQDQKYIMHMSTFLGPGEHWQNRWIFDKPQAVNFGDEDKPVGQTFDCKTISGELT